MDVFFAKFGIRAFWQGVGFMRKCFFGMFAQQFGLLQAIKYEQNPPGFYHGQSLAQS